MITKEEVFKIGQFAKPHGIKGELALVTNSDVLDDTDDPYVVCDIEGILVPFFVEEYRYKSGNVILLKLECVDSEEEARSFSGREVYYPLDGMEEDELVGQMTWDGFLGYTVIDQKHGELGAITGVDESTLNVLFQIDHKGQEILLPAAEELVVSIDQANKQMTVLLPDGLLDLY